MTFRRMKWIARAAVATLAMALTLGIAAPAAAEMGTAVIPKQIIYPGEEISAGVVEEVEVTNPKLAGEYARSINEVTGMVSTRTLLPGRTILLSGLRAPYAVRRGSSVRLGFNIGSMTISAAGTPLQDASIGDIVRVRNNDSGIIVSGTVMADGTIQVMSR
ncbi:MULTISPECIES: flagellar basal body P-ring formation chaperone FlgA [Pseudorhizobium]|jgi:flagellar basal body P-ring formation protein FlgA|uniref:Flagella basal body P-ring formation protein FlgA n=1 Tax=Pseudorhizobium pelagicum TaxID=1509405 RepID=A0A922P1J5_9HYPH|nr:flagellar basal body P-ring biosynthesis protein FlgA [Pseudorhizobium pelagicum]MBU1314014.1 flagellar basal body P-ring formation protein FlgA [Alphaproteobacteria bacterium]KEQ10748.1 flagellar basal body P-ring biosynthesis protein FlgA [Pseudorhizobium pelagicum]MBU1552366.1 flagellar basal body P-ring formation protein FlgA [Alphaproteobacteria bacterium]MBU2334559.1 flagellar basal body P-ring formation protein FlgA [Alphaproteobacteria bacterium]|tara:strand:+ start:95 stop:577 length:483 start_codon:yes stop_codon:yes gene_type:complete